MEATLSTSWHSYPKIFALGHAELAPLLFDDVVVEEKVDGSQFSFGRFDGELRVRSKGQQLDPAHPEKMFELGIAAVAELDLRDGWTYRAEYLAKPKHNALAYDRVPAKHVIVFDINTDHEVYLTREEKLEECARLGIECVPAMFVGKLTDASTIATFLECTSCLGGAKIEGVVIKNYKRFGRDKKALMGKFVSEEYKEVQKVAWRTSNPGHTDILETIVLRYRSEARWAKAVQHLRDAGTLEGSPRDIGAIMAEVQRDILEECRDEIATLTFNWAWEKVRRKLPAGVPQWYKEKLLGQQFEHAEAPSEIAATVGSSEVV